MRDPRGTRAWYALRDQVLADEPTCWLKLDGCTGHATTGDHVLTVKERPDLALEGANVRGACASCNNRRNDTPVGELDRFRRPKPAALRHFFP